MSQVDKDTKHSHVRICILCRAVLFVIELNTTHRVTCVTWHLRLLIGWVCALFHNDVIMMSSVHIVMSYVHIVLSFVPIFLDEMGALNRLLVLCKSKISATHILLYIDVVCLCLVICICLCTCVSISILYC